VIGVTGVTGVTGTSATEFDLNPAKKARERAFFAGRASNLALMCWFGLSVRVLDGRMRAASE
jgi:hypothetical protein